MLKVDYIDKRNRKTVASFGFVDGEVYVVSWVHPLTKTKWERWLSNNPKWHDETPKGVRLLELLRQMLDAEYFYATDPYEDATWPKCWQEWDSRKQAEYNRIMQAEREFGCLVASPEIQKKLGLWRSWLHSRQ